MFISRIRARLQGSHTQAGSAPFPHHTDPVAPPPRLSRWPSPRIAMAERLWGPGFLGPGGAAEITGLAAPLRLAPETRCLLVGTLLNGPSHALEATGAPVTSYTDDPALALRAGAREWRPDAPDFGSTRYDRALALEPLAALPPDVPLPPDGGPVLDALTRAIAPIGQIILTALVAAADGAPPAATLPGLLPAEPPVSNTLRRHGFGLHAIADHSARHVALARDAWNAAIAALPRVRLPEDAAQALQAEEALWRARLSLLASGQVRLLCWHATGKAYTGPLAHGRAEPPSLTAGTPPPS